MQELARHKEGVVFWAGVGWVKSQETAGIIWAVTDLKEMVSDEAQQVVRL